MDVVTIVKVLIPVFKVFSPVPVTVVVATSGTASIVILLIDEGTLTV